MAYHNEQKGHTRPVVGCMYTRSLKYMYKFVLKHFNEDTRICTLASVDTNVTYFISETTLSQWHRMTNTPEETK